MFRKYVFASYGVAVGSAYASAVLSLAGVRNPLAAVALVVILAAAFGHIGPSVSTMPKRPANGPSDPDSTDTVRIS